MLLQLIVVVTSSLSADRGELRRYENPGDGWHQVGAVVPVAIGERGLSFDKKEGDHKSPAGKFRVGQEYDAAPLVCVDDPTSSDYNSIVKSGRGEDMRTYRKAIVIDFNPQRIRGKGSCVFLHDGESPTVGCTAMKPQALDEIAAWLKPGAEIVQLPRADYQKLKAKWKLPSL
jgi:L,D-peptidoglycan transpeptidase YkuD (ErfK/YbiS/YcfS/YnhG family)